MKIKLWQFEYDFDREDAEIVVPVLLLLLGLFYTQLKREVLWSGTAAYYLLYFFLKPALRPCAAATTKIWAALSHWIFYRCPYCRSRQVILQGYDGYHSDEYYAHHLCNQCGETSVLVNDRLIKAVTMSALRKQS